MRSALSAALFGGLLAACGPPPSPEPPSSPKAGSTPDPAPPSPDVQDSPCVLDSVLGILPVDDDTGGLIPPRSAFDALLTDELQALLGDVKPGQSVQLTVDGATLDTCVYVPEDRLGKVPTILIRSPYPSAPQISLWYAMRYMDWLLEGRVAIVIQSERGTGGSTGTFRTYWADVEDGSATLDWITAQDWSDGTVGMSGGSALAVGASLLAGAEPTRLSALDLQMTGSNLYEQLFYPQGAMRWAESTTWFGDLADSDMITADVFSHDTRGPFWAAVQTQSGLRATPATTSTMTGWYDIMLDGSIDGFNAFDPSGGDDLLVIGPWQHALFACAPAPSGPIPCSLLAYPGGLDSPCSVGTVARAATAEGLGLKGLQHTDAIPTVQYYVMGPLNQRKVGNEWRSADQFPPASTNRALHLQPDGTLADQSASGAVTWTHSRYAPVRTAGGRLLWMPGSCPSGVSDWYCTWFRPGAIDLKKAWYEGDQFLHEGSTARFVTEPLTDSLEVVGKVTADLALQTDHGDAAAWLVDVYPDGTERVLAVGYAGLQGSGTQKVTVDLSYTASVFAPGHQIGLYVASSNWPAFELRDQDETAEATPVVLKTQSSQLNLPIPNTPDPVLSTCPVL